MVIWASLINSSTNSLIVGILSIRPMTCPADHIPPSGSPSFSAYLPFFPLTRWAISLN